MLPVPLVGGLPGAVLSPAAVAWGGRTYPRVVLNTEAPVPGRDLYQFSVFDGVPLLEVGLKLLPVRQSVADTIVGQTRRRVGGWRLDVTISFNAPGNSRLVEFLRRAHDPDACDYLRVYPHPGELWTYNWSRDWFKCVLVDDFAPEYYLKKWLGHAMTLRFRGAEELPRWPQSSAALGATGTRFVFLAGVATPDAATGPSRWGERYWGSATGWEVADDREVAYWENAVPWSPRS